jgi:hypothetical protein
MSHPTIFLVADQGVPITMLAQGPVNSDVRKQIRLVRYQSEKISASYQVQGFGEKWPRNYLPTFLVDLIAVLSVYSYVYVLICLFLLLWDSFVTGTTLPFKKMEKNVRYDKSGSV